MSIKGRPAQISFKDFNEETKEVYVVNTTARFHCWGIRKQKGDSPRIRGMETVGVCELATGGIKLVQPERIKFLDVQAP